MPLTVCRCCGGKMEPDERRLNPNICPSCERLLEDESPMLMADMAKMTPARDGEAPLTDKPATRPKTETKPATVPPTKNKPSAK